MRIILTAMLALIVGTDAFAFQKKSSPRKRTSVQRQQQPAQQRYQYYPPQQQQQQFYYGQQQQQYYYRPQQMQPGQQYQVQRPQTAQQQPQFTPGEQLFYRYRLANGQIRLVPLNAQQMQQYRVANPQRFVAQQQTAQWHYDRSTGRYFKMPQTKVDPAAIARKTEPEQSGVTDTAPGTSTASTGPMLMSGPSLGPVPESPVVQTGGVSDNDSKVVPASGTETVRSRATNEGPALSPVPSATDAPPTLPELSLP